MILDQTRPRRSLPGSSTPARLLRTAHSSTTIRATITAGAYVGLLGFRLPYACGVYGYC